MCSLCLPSHPEKIAKGKVFYIFGRSSCTTKILYVYTYNYKHSMCFAYIFIVKGSLVEKLPIYEQDRRVIAQSSHSSVKSQLSQVTAQSVTAQSSNSSVKSQFSQVTAQSSHSSVKSQLSQVTAQSSHSSVK